MTNNLDIPSNNSDLVSSDEQRKRQEIAGVEQSNQMRIFVDMYGVDKDNGSNIFNEWDFHPIYTVSKQEQALRKKLDGSKKIIRHDYHLKGVPYSISITPAIIENKDGTEELYYPSESEELVELALRKIMMRMDSVAHFPKREVWIRFSLYEVLSILKESGHSMDLNDLKHCLNVMAGTKIEIKKGKQTSYDGNILLEILRNERHLEHLDTEDGYVGGSGGWAVKLNSLMADDLDKYNFRQMNNRIIMQTKKSTSKHIIKVLISGYINAGLDAAPYVISANEVINACRINYSRTRDNYKHIRESFEEIRKLKNGSGKSAYINEHDTDDIQMLREEIIKKGKSIVEILFHVTPSKAFIDFTKAANKRERLLKDLRQL